jgi:hypothetical protein
MCLLSACVERKSGLKFLDCYLSENFELILMHPLLGAGGVSGELWRLVSAIHEEAMV